MADVIAPGGTGTGDDADICRRATEISPIATAVFTLDGRFLRVNPAMCDFLGRDADSLAAMTWQQLTVPTHVDTDLVRTKDLLAGRLSSYRATKQYIHSDGHLIWGDLSVSCIRDGRGNPEYLVAQIIDVTPEITSTREELEEARRRQAAADALYRRSMDSAAIGMCLADVKGNFIDVNPAMCEFFGYDAPDLLGMTWQELTAPDYLQADLDQRDEVLAGRIDSYRMVKQFVHADGHLIWGELSVGCVRAPDGQVETFIKHINDITAEVETREHLELARRRQAASDALFRRSVDSAAVGMCLVDTDGGIADVNSALCDFFGYDAATLKQKTWQELTAPDYLQADLDAVADVLAGRIDSYRMVKQYLHADGHSIWGDLSVGCVRAADGTVEVLIAQVNDITSAVRTREQLAVRDEQNRVLAQRLSSEIHTAAAYVVSTLPADLHGQVEVSSRYLPSQELGGDCFNFTWITDDLLLIYLIDVSGHGVGPALLSMSVHNVMRSGSLPTTTLARPDRVLTELNGLFRMEEQGGNYFTMWVGVYQSSTRTLRYASAGHPPAMALNATAAGTWTCTPLTTQACPVGMFADTAFEADSYPVPPGCRMLLFSDGVFEFPRPGGRQSSLHEFTDLATRIVGSEDFSIDTVVAELLSRTADGVFDDDCSMIAVEFD